jgi:hypothetical protein
MQIRFSNYRKVYIILGVFVIFLGSLYVVSVIYSRNRSKIDNTKLEGKETSFITPPIYQANINGENRLTVEQEKLLTEKTSLLISSLANNSLVFQSDIVFQNVNSELINRISSEIKKFPLPIVININEVWINPDMSSGTTYVRVMDRSDIKNDLLEFDYLKNEKGEWQLADFVIHIPG